MANAFWTTDEELRLQRIKNTSNLSWEQVGAFFPDKTTHAVRQKWYTVRDTGAAYLQASEYPVYDKPLVTYGDALVLPDVEAPFHNAQFVNKCLDLATAWEIPNLVLPGDALHMNSISAWEANWIDSKERSGLTLDDQDEILTIAAELSPDKREQLMDAVESIGRPKNDTGSDLGGEMREARAVLKTFAKRFDDVVYGLGNHEGRFIKALNSAMFVEDFSQYMGLDPKFRIAPYYFSLIVSNGVTYRATHPKGSANYTAAKLADMHQMHILMAHSHKWNMTPSRSGKYQGWHIGCCVDERRLPYASQRDNTADAHKLGAAIVRNGYLWPLSDDWTDWDSLFGM